jgi:hypothetical protein
MQKKTYNSGDSPVVTHLTTNPPVHRLSTAERTGSAMIDVLWSYVEVMCGSGVFDRQFDYSSLACTSTFFHLKQACSCCSAIVRADSRKINAVERQLY